MLPQFPEFKKLELSDKEEVENFTSRFPPYSDFNFVSMWCWDIKGEMRISKLNGNLVARFNDYMTGEPFYSFLGNTNVNETAEKLLEISKKEGLKVKLKLISEDSITDLDKRTFKIEEDLDNFDYIYDLKLISEYRGRKFSDKRSNINVLLRNFANMHVEYLNLKNLLIQKEIIKLNKNWIKYKIGKDIDFKIKNESFAIEKFVQLETQNIIGVGIFFDKKLVGYSIFEILPNRYSICHFSKADNHFDGIYDYLTKESAKILTSNGCSFLNYEQDLGILGLRRAKISFRPISFLKKFICTYSDKLYTKGYKDL